MFGLYSQIAYTMSSPALTEAVFPLNRSVMAYLIVSMAKMRKTVQVSWFGKMFIPLETVIRHMYM